MRFQLVQRCPSLRSVNRAVPLSIKYGFFGFSRIILNDNLYQVGIYRDLGPSGPPIPRFLRENRSGGICYDINEYGERDNALDRLLTPGDIHIPSPYPLEELTPEEEEEFIETMKRRLAELKQMRRMKGRQEEIDMIEAKLLTWHQKRQGSVQLPFTPYLQFTIKRPNGTKTVERMVYNKKVADAMKYLYDELFGGRQQFIRVQNLKISSTGGVLRLPEGMQVRVQELFMGSNVDEVMRAFGPLMIKGYTPEDIGVIDGNCLAMNYDHPIIKAAKVFIINKTAVTGQLFHIVMGNTNERLDVQNGNITVEELLMLIEKVARDRRKIGTCYSFGLHSKRMVKELFRELKAKPGWIAMKEGLTGSCRFPHTLIFNLNKFAELTVCCIKNPRFENNNGLEPWILWIRVEYCM